MRRSGRWTGPAARSLRPRRARRAWVRPAGRRLPNRLSRRVVEMDVPCHPPKRHPSLPAGSGRQRVKGQDAFASGFILDLRQIGVNRLSYMALESVAAHCNGGYGGVQYRYDYTEIERIAKGVLRSTCGEH